MEELVASITEHGVLSQPASCLGTNGSPIPSQSVFRLEPT
ncbi:MAG: hypothetical protein WCI75_05275 [candidate division NC10 bacterium]